MVLKPTQISSSQSQSLASTASYVPDWLDGGRERHKDKERERDLVPHVLARLSEEVVGVLQSERKRDGETVRECVCKRERVCACIA